MIKTLSLIVPAYKQEKTITADITHLNNVLSPLPYKYEIIVVEDGKLDGTAKKLKNLKSKIKQLKVLGYPRNQGKGYAVKYGILRAKGDLIGFIDAGMDIDPTSLLVAIDYMNLRDADIILGSKLHSDSEVEYPRIRRILSWGYRNFTHILFGFDVKDTQVGLKIFKRKVARDIFKRIIIKKFAFDIEVLAVATSLGYKKIYESPVKLKFNWDSTIESVSSLNFWQTIFLMLWDTAAVYYRLKILHYYDRK